MTKLVVYEDIPKQLVGKGEFFHTVLKAVTASFQAVRPPVVVPEKTVSTDEFRRKR